MCTCIYMNSYVGVFVNVYMHVCMIVYAHNHSHEYTHPFKNTHIHRNKHTDTHPFSRTDNHLITWYRVAKTHKMAYLCRSFSAKEPLISGSFEERDLQLERHPMGLGHPVRLLDRSNGRVECKHVCVNTQQPTQTYPKTSPFCRTAYVYICIHLYKYIYIYTFVYLYIYIHIYAYIRIHRSTFIYTWYVYLTYWIHVYIL